MGIVYTRAHVLLRGVFDCLSRVGPQDTGFSVFGFVIGKRGPPVPVFSSPPRSRCIHAVVASPSSWTGYLGQSHTTALLSVFVIPGPQNVSPEVNRSLFKVV